MPAKKESHVTLVVGQVLNQMSGERWEELRLILSTRGLRALIAATSLEETRIIQTKVAELTESAPPQQAELSLFSQFQEALKLGLRQATHLSWPALHHESFDA